MKKIYFLLMLSFLSVSTFATTWYAQTGYADTLTSWWSDPTYTGTNPTSFATVGDVWIMNGNMGTGGVWNLAGSLVLDSSIFVPSYDVSIGTNMVGGDLTLNGASVFGADSTISTDITVTLYGNLSVSDVSYIYNYETWTRVVFANTGSSISAPQNIGWTSTSPYSDWSSIVIDSNVTVQLLTNVTLPADANQPEMLNGTLVGNTFFLSNNGNDFTMNNGAALYTQEAGGVDSAIINTRTLTIANGTIFNFNGTVPQVTGFNMPNYFTTGGGVTILNAAGVTLSQSTSFDNGTGVGLFSGNLTLGDNYLALGDGATLSGTFSPASMIVTNGSGQLYKQFTADGSYTFPVGDTDLNYTPITVNVTATAYGPSAYVAANVVNSKHPANANVTDYLNRYWSVDIADMTGATYTTSATYVPTDVMGTEANISAGAYSSLPWVKYGPADVTTHTLTSTADSNFYTDFSGISTAGPSVTSSADTAVCIGSSANLNVVSVMTDSPFSYTWAPSDGLSATTGASVVATPTVTTSYTVTVTDGNGFTATAMTNVTVNQYPNVDSVMGGGSYCEGGAGADILLNLSDTGVSYQAYQAGVAMGSAVAGTDTAIDLGPEANEGSYYVIATGTTTGCSIAMADSAYVTITATVNPMATIASSMGDTLCAGTMTTFSTMITNGGTAPMLQWIKNGANVGTADSSSYSYTPSNGDVVVVKLTSNAICATPDSVTDTMVISVLANGTPTVAITATPDTTVCTGTIVTVNATPTYGGYAPSYTWVLNTLIVATGSSYAYMPANGDHIFAILNSNYRCRLATTAYSNVEDMVVDAAVVPSVTIAATQGLKIKAGTPDTLVATVYNGGVNPSYQWSVNNIPVPAATSNTFIQNSFSNSDSVSCKVTRNDACGLSSINSVVFKVYSVGTQQITFTGADISLTPNPNNGTFTIKGSLGSNNDEAVTMEVTNMLGQVVYKNNVIAVNGQLNAQVQTANSLAAGVYILNLHSANGSGTFRFVVEK